MTPREATLRLGGVWSNERGMAPCPLPDHGKGRGDLNWSLSLRGGESVGLLVHCFAGCPSGEVLAAIRRLEPAGTAGQDQSSNRHVASFSQSPVRAAETFWRSGVSVHNTPAEAYLTRRGLPSDSVALRYLAGARHPNSAGRKFPALLSAISDCSGKIIAVQRTFLEYDGAKASIAPNRMMLGRLNRGSVRLAPADDVLGLAEGVETALSASRIFGVPVWAACGARLSQVALPAQTRHVILFADHDEPGMEAAQAAARRFRAQGKTVEIVRPKTAGADWNDVLTTRERVSHVA